MAYASKAGRAVANASSPDAFCVCDRCSMWWNRSRMQWQYDWRGPTLQNLRILVCPPCYDSPQQQLRSIVIPADPLPVIQPRVEPFLYDSTNDHTVSAAPTIDPLTGIPVPGTTTFLTQDGQAMTEIPLGNPPGLDRNAVMPLYGQQAYGVLLALLSVTSNGSDQISVTCSTAHGLQTGSQIAASGLADSQADGFYSVVVNSAMALQYQTVNAIPADALLTPTTTIVTALVGTPRGYITIPQV